MNRIALLLCVTAFMVGCSSTSDYHQIEGQAQGTTFHIKYHGVGAENHSEEIAQILTDFDKSLSLWRKDSFLSQLNADPDSVVQIPKTDKYFVPVFVGAMQVYRATGGAFDPSVYPLVRAWGFGAIPPDSDSIPDVLLIKEKHHIGDLRANLAAMGPDQAIMRPTGMELDFNGIAQGFSVDVISEYLDSKGISDYMVEIGGELRTSGLRPDSIGWTIGIDRPQDGPRELATTMILDNAAMATSGSYRKYKELDGKRYSHCIDPRTGYPVEHTLLSVTVIAPTCMEADAYATAFMVMGIDQTLAKLKGPMGKRMEVLLIYDKDGENKMVGTGRFKSE